MPVELKDAWMLKGLDVPLASSWVELQNLPAMLVTDYLIVRLGIQDADEWNALHPPESGATAPATFGG